jgi:hypothetical protein
MLQNLLPIPLLPNRRYTINKASNKRVKLLINVRFSAVYNSGWHFILKHQGHQSEHIHPNGWLSEVIYLKVVPFLGKDEGGMGVR